MTLSVVSSPVQWTTSFLENSSLWLLITSDVYFLWLWTHINHVLCCLIFNKINNASSYGCTFSKNSTYTPYDARQLITDRLQQSVCSHKVILESAPALLNTSQIVTLFLKNRESLLSRRRLDGQQIIIIHYIYIHVFKADSYSVAINYCNYLVNRNSMYLT